MEVVKLETKETKNQTKPQTAKAPVRQLPVNDLDLQMQLTNSEWGDLPKSAQLGAITHDYSITYLAGTKVLMQDKKLTVLKEEITIISEQGSWGLLAYLTRDMRLGNLTGEEVDVCKHLLDLAGDCLQEGYSRSFSAAIKRVAHILEISQSRKGFFRKLLNTIRREDYRSDITPHKSTFFGGKKGGHDGHH